MSDTLILGNADLATEPAAVDLPAPGWAKLAPGVYCQGDASGYAGAATIDVVGVADANGFEAQFLLLP